MTGKTIRFALRGRPGRWTTESSTGRITHQVRAASAAPPGDGLPNPQAFDPFVRRAYPLEVLTCRQCDQLDVANCRRGYCRQLARNHEALINAVADHECPLDRFPPKQQEPTHGD